MALISSPVIKPKPFPFSPLPPSIKLSKVLNFGHRTTQTHQLKTTFRRQSSSLFDVSNKNNGNGKMQAVADANGTSLEPEEAEQQRNWRRILLSDVVVKRKRQVLWGRKWNALDIGTAGVILAMHTLCLFAPFYVNWGAFWVAFGLYVVTGLLGITLSFHRNLSHRSFKLPKWLEYSFAYCGVLALQCGGPSNVGDLEKQPFYQFVKSTYILHPLALAVLLYAAGGFPFLVWGMGVRTVWVFHITWLVNSACHVWGKQTWNTGDLSRNNWWVALLAFGEGWHNNHHAFEYSARHGLEWWQLDMTWYVVRFLQAIGLATDVKLPTEVHRQRMAINN
ncbi:hypothetical protein Tsubulata_013042 [Turnera subulata]|uniref:Fatty acid desaturase domain-containing protein n=1 Tax=Turnera subulata TaxID=218843 RepID=A0A9Q0JLX6_9ROSI|nr:hypothetical protein Tsubulata_013042 [Turnera subulata]